MIGRRIPHVEELVASARLEISAAFAEFVWAHRLNGLTYREIAQNEHVHPSTIRNYVKWIERTPGYASEKDLAPKSNSVSLTCAVCEGTFRSPRADKRYCSNACRQDAYRHRKAGRITEAA